MLFAAAMLFLAMNKHSRSGPFNYHSELWGDKAGYYVYLPAALKYGFDPARFPDSVDVKTGHGFRLDQEQGRVVTKYFYGTALMQLPFYLAADLLAPLAGQPRDGFAPVYHKAVNVAAVFYLVLGLFLLYRFLRTTLRRSTVVLVLLSLVFGTNLYFYAVDETGMSHVYSFALFAAFLLMMQRWFARGNLSAARLLLMAAVAAIIVLVRPTGLIFVAFAVWLFIHGKEDFRSKIVPLLRPGNLARIVLPFVMLAIPQLLYWNRAYDGFTLYSYSNEGFNWLHPQPQITLLSPDNGLLLYTPFFILILWAILQQLFKGPDRSAGIKTGLLFVVITYVFSCWWIPDFGCSFGARNYVEYYAMFALPLGYLFRSARNMPAAGKWAFGLLVILLVAFNLKMTYAWDECYFGTGYWDWAEYFRLVFAPV